MDAAWVYHAAEEISSMAEILHWYDFTCPFSYVGQHRTAILTRRGLVVTLLPFQSHPEIPVDGMEAGPRYAHVYTTLEREAKAAGLPLRWPDRIPNTRRALAAAEWVRRNRPESFAQVHRDLFAAHFALGEDIGDPAVIERIAQTGGELDEEAVAESEALGRGRGMKSTPAWLISGQMITAFRPASDFERLARNAAEG